MKWAKNRIFEWKNNNDNQLRFGRLHVVQQKKILEEEFHEMVLSQNGHHDYQYYQYYYHFLQWRQLHRDLDHNHLHFLIDSCYYS